MKNKMFVIISVGVILLGLLIIWTLKHETDIGKQDDFIVKIETNEQTLPKVKASLTYIGDEEEVTISKSVIS